LFEQERLCVLGTAEALIPTLGTKERSFDRSKKSGAVSRLQHGLGKAWRAVGYAVGFRGGKRFAAVEISRFDPPEELWNQLLL
jgi:hypothetical protein